MPCILRETCSRACVGDYGARSDAGRAGGSNANTVADDGTVRRKQPTTFYPPSDGDGGQDFLAAKHMVYRNSRTYSASFHRGDLIFHQQHLPGGQRPVVLVDDDDLVLGDE